MLLGFLGWGICGTALDLNDVAFHLSFDKGVNADMARGNGTVLEKGGNPQLVKGKTGKALKLINGKDFIVFDLKGNLNPKEGAISFWLSPVNWDGSMNNVLQIFLHTNGSDSQQQLAVQTLWPFGKLFMPLYNKGNLLTGTSYWSFSPAINLNNSKSNIKIGFEEDEEYMGQIRKKLLSSIQFSKKGIKNIQEFKLRTQKAFLEDKTFLNNHP